MSRGSRRRAWFAFVPAVLLVAALLSAAGNGCTPPTTTTETTMGTVPPMRPITSPIYGVTLDGDSTLTNAQKKAALDALPPAKVMARIVFDKGVAPGQYTSIIDALQPTTFLMGEVLDSESLANITTANYLQRTNDYHTAHGEKIDVWEIGNEIGGKWAGSYDGLQGQVAKIAAAYDEVKARGKKTALTLWHNVQCEDTGELTPLQFIQQKLPARMKTGLDYLFLSYYEVPCGRRPPMAEWKSYFEAIHGEMPQAKLGFGEVGLEWAIGTDPKIADATEVTLAVSIANFYYGLSQAMGLASWYVGGYFWWYFEQDGIPQSKPHWTTIANNMDY